MGGRSQLSEESRLALDKLLSREWQSYQGVREQLAGMVAPGRANRAYDTRESYRLARGQSNSVRVSDPVERLRRGQSALARIALSKLVHSRRAEVAKFDGIRYIRLGPRQSFIDDLMPSPRPDPPRSDSLAGVGLRVEQLEAQVRALLQQVRPTCCWAWRQDTGNPLPALCGAPAGYWAVDRLTVLRAPLLVCDAHARVARERGLTLIWIKKRSER